MNPTIVRAADAAQFLSFVPRMLGYRPAGSLVLIPFQGSRSIGGMRFDLPSDEPDAVDRIASTVIGMACRLAEADGVAVIAYTDARFGDEGGMPHRELADALERRADACGLRVTDALCVAADGWGSYLDSDCPREGRPLQELAVAATGLDLPGAPELGDQAAGAELPASDLAQRERVGRALVALRRAVQVLCGEDAAGPPAGDVVTGADSADAAGVSEDAADLAPAPAPPVDEKGAEAGPARPAAPGDAPATPGGGVGTVDDDAGRVDPRALATVCRLDDLPTLFEDALGWNLGTLDPFDAAAMIWCLSRPALRDVALVQWSGNLAEGDEALDAQLRWEAGEEYPAHLAMRMWGEGERPDVGRLEAALEVARGVAAAAPRSSRPGPLAMCAWLSWALGRSTHADAYAGWACEIEPEHGLSEIVRSFVQAGHLPDWAFRKRPR